MALEILPDTQAIDRRLDQLAASGPIAPVASQTPLIANLSARENLELVGAFHGRQGSRELAATARETLALLEIPHCAEHRPAALTDQEAFRVQVARAAMRTDALKILVTPFIQVPSLESDHPIHGALQALAIRQFRILDLPSHRHRYTLFSEVAS